MSGNESAGARILSAQARHCEHMAAEVAAARAAGATPAELADLEDQEMAARKRYQELAVDMPVQGHGIGAGLSSRGRRPWWRIW
jgi:hypothetical protein